jgi:ABC-type antimicrobial peptide transport system permease subunit
MAEMAIKRVGVLSLAKIQGLLMLVIGLIIGVVYGLIFILFGAALTSLMPKDESQALSAGGTVLIGVIMMIAIPITYGLLGFIGGAIGGLIYNALARVVGGIKIDLEATTPGYIPPPPQPWSPGQQ